MFKHITIELSGPICSCEEKNLKWGIRLTMVNRMPVMDIMCKTCKTMLCVPHEKIGALIHLDEPYPNDVLELKDDDGPNKEGSENNVAP